MPENLPIVQNLKNVLETLLFKNPLTATIIDFFNDLGQVGLGYFFSVLLYIAIGVLIFALFKGILSLFGLRR